MKLSELARELGGELLGDGDLEVSGLAALSDAGDGDLSFVLEKRYLEDAQESGAGALVCFEKLSFASHQIVVSDARKALYEATQLFSSPDALAWGISAAASVDESVVFEGDVYVGSGAFIGANCRIGAGSVIHPNVTILEGTFIGANCVIFPGAVIGGDGFGFYQDKSTGRWQRMGHLGRVVLGDRVHIGANTTVDRGCLGDTVIGDGCIIDNLCQIAHNVQLGTNCAVAANCGMSGSVRLGDNVIVAGQVGFSGHNTIGSGSVLMARAGITKDFPAGSVVSGFPAQSHDVELKSLAKLRKFLKK